MNIEDMLHEMVEREASDLHLKAGSPPGLRIHGSLVAMEGYDDLTAEQCHVLIDELMSEEQREIFERDRDIDFSKHLSGVARFRINVFQQRGSRAAVLRMIPLETPVLEEMGFPAVLQELCRKPRGMLLVTGPTGSGKSTTLAAMVDYINRHEYGHIISLEDPIEFVHHDKRCYVNQREIGVDTRSFHNGLRAALREDPDYILVGEMRDLETIELAITAAETGHLVFATLHTTSAVTTVDRIVDVFPHDAQAQVRTQLASTLQAVVSQTLLPRIGGGRTCAQEIMIGTDAIRSCIREGKSPQILNMIQTGAQYGMQTLENALAELVSMGEATPDDAIAKANTPDSLRKILERMGSSGAIGRRIAMAAKRANDVGHRVEEARILGRGEYGADAGPTAPGTAGGGASLPGPTDEETTTRRRSSVDDEFEQFRKRRQRGD